MSPGPVQPPAHRALTGDAGDAVPHAAIPRRTLAATATSSRKAVNQDACRSVVNTKAGLTGVVVSDGIGSQFGAALASTLAVDALTERLERLDDAAALDLGALYRDVNDVLTAHVQQVPDVPSGVDVATSFGTTLLCAIETASAFTLAYVGNGAIIHARGNVATFPQTYLLPWSAVNVLNPHTVPERGRSVLYKHLAPFASAQMVTPTVVTISKDPSIFGDVVIVCSDGITSIDQTRVGTDDEGEIWIHGPRGLAVLYQHLSSFLTGGARGQAELDRMLDAYLDALSQQNLIADDSSIGILVTPQAVRVHTASADPSEAPTLAARG